MTYIGDAVPGRDEMADWQYREENPGYQRETGLTASDFADINDPDFAIAFAEHIAADNAAIRERNARTTEDRLRAENENLRALLREHGITPPEEEPT